MLHRVILSGGLGNQMFQYAFYLSLRSKGIISSIDTTLFDLLTMHNGYELCHAFGLKGYNQSSKLHQIWIRFIKKFKPKCIVSSDIIYSYSETVYLAPKKYFIGDWINEQYFLSIETIVKQSFIFQHISKKNSSLANSLRSHNSVSIHIRRGDYLTIQNYNVCNEYYYFKAIGFIQDAIENPVFYVFSDDPKWADSFMKSTGVCYKLIDWNTKDNSYQDMFLMSNCKHNIIANSTFSWWGAWLNDNTSKLVIAPMYWFQNNNLNANCPGWHLIDNRYKNE